MHIRRVSLLLLAAFAAAVCEPLNAQPFEPGQGLVPAGNLRTSDGDGPYNISLLDVQANEVRHAQIAKDDFTDRDIIDFLVNVECLEGQFDTYGAFGHGFFQNLSMGGPKPRGAKKAKLDMHVRPFVEEIALSEQGHALFTRQAGSLQPCPAIDIEGGFNKFMGRAYDLPQGETVLSTFGEPFDPFKNTVNFLVSMLLLEENGATGNKGLAGLLANPVLSTSVAGLATAATGFAAVERTLLWQRRREIVDPFNETALEVFARISALRDELDGPPLHTGIVNSPERPPISERIVPQGLINSDPRFINVRCEHVNAVPTDVRGLTFNRSPQQVINILTIGEEGGPGKGGFFPEGFVGRINRNTNYDKLADGYEEFPFPATVAVAAPTMDVGEVSPPLTPDHNPHDIPGETQLTQDFEEVHYMDGTPKWRGIEQARRKEDLPKKEKKKHHHHRQREGSEWTMVDLAAADMATGGELGLLDM